MKNLKCFPFERNRYFYGKLLSVDDFETEQKYFNDKRRTVNRFLFGSGVVCGLNVVEVDEETVSIERGLALDFAGREIVVDEPVVKKISDLEGYDGAGADAQDSGYYYLCVEYHEDAAEPVHNMAGNPDKTGSECNKYKEGYRLFVTQTEPERQIFTPEYLYEERQTVYSGQGIKISQILPRYLEMGADTVLRVEIENCGQEEEFSFEYELALSFMTYNDEISVRVRFDEKDYAKEKKYRLEIPLKAAFVNDTTAEASVKVGSFVMHVGEREFSSVEHCTSRTQISSQDSLSVLRREYYKGAMDYAMKYTFQQSIYLARIYVVNAAKACVIQRIEPLPFGQSILNTEISSAMIGKLAEDIRKLKVPAAMPQEKKPAENKTQVQPPEITGGELYFDLDEAANGQVLYSDRIAHGLGLGPVTITLGYEVENGAMESGQIMYGDSSVFQSWEEGFDAKLAARLDAAEGTFVIGLKLRRNKGAKRVKVYWTAFRNPVLRQQDQDKKQIFIQPDIPNVYTGESISFVAIQEGFQDDRLKWSVKDLDGGKIDKEGKYTAPDTEGVYQVSVESMAYPEVRAITFVVVRNKEET